MARFSLRDNQEDSAGAARRIPLKRLENTAADAPIATPESKPTPTSSKPTYSLDPAPVDSKTDKPAIAVGTTKIHPDSPPAYKIDENVFYAYIVPRGDSRSLDVIVLTHPDEGFVPRKVRDVSFSKPSYELVFERPPADCKQDPRLAPYVSGAIKLPKGGMLRRYSPPFLAREVRNWKDSPRYESPEPKS